MGNSIITLRNIYKVLTKADYPMPSHNVLADREKTGLVQTTFLQEMCATELQSGQIGKMLWRDSETRSRTFSSLCNRTLPLSTYEKYANEIIKQLSPRLIYNQARRFGLFLLRHDYDYGVLMARLQKLIEIAGDNGENEKETQIFLEKVFADAVQTDTANTEKKKGFGAGFVLAWLFICAMTDKAFGQLLRKIAEESERYELGAFIVSSDKKGEVKPVTYYGSLRSIAGASAMPAHKYFGHEDELLDLRDAISTQEKIWIHGIGGIGKTELVRQAMRQCVSEHIVDGICLIQYTHNLAFSIRKSFPNYDVNVSEEGNETVNDILAYLSDHLGQSGLLVIDNMDRIGDEDHGLLKRLSTEAYSVVITSRITKTTGYIPFVLRESSPQECLSIYRANQGSVMSNTDKELFITLMQNPVLCHPQTVYLLSKTARSRGLSLEDIIAALQDNALLLGGKYQANDLVQMYKTLYSLHDLDYDERRLTDFFTMLPVNSYDADWLEKNFETHDKKVIELAQTLAEAGILNESDGCYSMHPLVAQCLRKKSANEKRLCDLFEKMADSHLLSWETFAKITTISKYMTGQYWITCEVLFHISDMLLKYVHQGNLIPALCQSYHVLNVSHKDYSRQSAFINQRLHEVLNDNLLADKVCILLDSKYLAVDDRAEKYISVARSIMSADLPRSLLDTDVLIHLGYGLVQAEHINDSIEILENATGLSTDVELQLIGYGYLAERCYFSGQLQKCNEVVHKALNLIDNDESINALDKARTMACCFNLLLTYNEYDELEKRIDELEKLADGDELPIPVRVEEKTVALTARANLYLTLGKPEEALQTYLRYAEYIRKTTGSDSYAYLMVMHTIAMTYRAMGNVSKATEYFEEALLRVDSSTPVMSTLLILNNYAVLNLEHSNAEKALELLNRAAVLPLEDETPLGEVYRNFGRTYDLLKQDNESLVWWEKAYPLLARMYGPQHERTIYAENRIKELS